MSNSIWEMPDVKPNPADEIVFMIGDLPCVGYWFAAADEFLDLSTDNRYVPDEIDRWAIFADLITQADKAERLAEENEAMRDEFEVWHGNYECVVEDKERLQKAVDLAQERLLSISDGYDIMKADTETIKRLFYAIQDEASETYKEIKQLIKEKTNEQSNAD